MHFHHSFLCVFAFTRLSFSAFHYPNALNSRLEHLLVDTDGAFRSGFKDAITPCSNYVSGSQNFGRQTSAQWLRVAFHDFVTAHVGEGTGGMDASISLETLRAEDSGSAFNDTFAWFVPFIDARTSAADLLATAVVLSLGNCGGLHVPLRGGRVDAHEPGPFGVPEPETDLEETLEFFANAGFNSQDAIGLTACGHSLGRIHHGGFPQVVPESAVTPNNTAGGINLDTTPTNFDINVVTEYLEWKGQRGGPLVTSDNITVRSDLRLYESDRNATMKVLGQSAEYFASTCRNLFERMINTVPKEVELSDVVEPIVVKPVNVTFDIAKSGDVVLRGSIRLLSSSTESAPENIQVSLSAGENTASKTIFAGDKTGYSVFGNTTFYPFSLTMPSYDRRTLNKVHLTVLPAQSSMQKQTFILNHKLFFIPSLSTRDARTLRIAIAVLGLPASNTRSPKISAKISYPTEQIELDTLVPAMRTSEVDASFHHTMRNGFELWNATWTVPENTNWSATSLDIEGIMGEINILDEYNLVADLPSGPSDATGL